MFFIHFFARQNLSSVQSKQNEVSNFFCERTSFSLCGCEMEKENFHRVLCQRISKENNNSDFDLSIWTKC